MGCTRCGTDAQLIELLINKFIKDALADGTLQAGLNDCYAQKLEKSTAVITCHSLEEAICQLTSDGRLCFDKPVALDYDKDTDTLSIIMSNGNVLKTTIDTKDLFVARATFSEADGLVTFHYNDSAKEPFTVDLSSLKNKVTATKADDGTVTITNQDGSPIRIDPVKVNATEAPDGTVTITNQDNSTVAIPPVKVKAVKATNGDTTITNQDGTTVVIEAPTVTPDLVFKNTSGKVTLGYAFQDGGTKDQNVSVPRSAV